MCFVKKNKIIKTEKQYFVLQFFISLMMNR